MEKIEKKKHPRKLETDLGLRILALIIAVIIWLILSMTQYPIINKTITNIPVDFSMDGTKADEKGLSVLNYKDITVDVEIKGMNYEIGNYSANDLVATVNVDEVTKEGTYTLDIDVKSAHSGDKVTIVSVYPETMEVSFDRISSSTLKLGYEAPYVRAADGLTLKEISVSPNEVEIEAAENDLKKVDKVVASVTDSVSLSEDTTISTENLIFYDADDNILDAEKYTVKSNKNFDLNFVIYKKKTVKFNIEFVDCPPGFDTTSLPYKFSESSIQVITPNLEDPDTEVLKLGTISLKEVNLTKKFTFDVTSMLANGEINQTGVQSVDVIFDDDGYSSKTFTLPSSVITTQNIPNGKTVTIETKQLSNVTVYGPESYIKSVSEDDLTVLLNLTDVSNTGSINHAVSVYSADNSEVWCYGTVEVQVTIADKVVATNSTSN